MGVVDPTVPPPSIGSRPKSVDVSITGGCNLRCQVCFYADEMAALSDLPTERWLACFQEMGALAVQRVTLSGGAWLIFSDGPDADERCVDGSGGTWQDKTPRP